MKERFFAITLVFTIISLTCSPFFSLSAGENISSDLIVGEDQSIHISDTEYVLKGSIWISEGGTLDITDSDIQIYQDFKNQYDITLEAGSRLNLINSTLEASKAIDINFGYGSSIMAEDSAMNIPGKLTGNLKNARFLTTEIDSEELNLAADKIVFSDCDISFSSTMLSSDNIYVNDTICHSEIVLHSQSHMEMYGSYAESIDVKRGSEAIIFRKLEISVFDKIMIPVPGAQIQAEDYLTGEVRLSTETGQDGVWEGYLKSEIKRYNESDYFGNYKVTCSGISGEGSSVTKNIALRPLQKYSSSEISSLERVEDLVFKFDELMSPDSYYASSVNDLKIAGTQSFDIRTYPNEGLNTYIQQGNIVVEDSSEINIGEDSDVKILQGEEDYRIEVRDGASFTINNGSHIYSDKPINIYLFGSSSFSSYGSDLNIGTMACMDSSKIFIENSKFDADDIYFSGSKLDVKNSEIYAGKIDVSVENLSMKDSNIITEEQVKISSYDYDLYDVDFDKTVLFRSDKEEITITNVSSPEIKAGSDLVIYRRWWISARIENSGRRLVPHTNLNIYRITNEENILSESYEVDDGRISFPAVSEVISSSNSTFIGNYILRSNKTRGDEIIQSEETMVGLDSNADPIVKYTQHFPYKITTDINFAKNVYEANESFMIDGVAYYEGADIELSNASVKVNIRGYHNLSWTTVTNEDGEFSLELRSPPISGAHTMTVEITDERMNMESNEHYGLKVDGEEKEYSLKSFMFDTPLGIIITLVVILILTVLAVRIALWTPTSNPPSLSKATSDDLVKWAEEILDK